MMSALKRLLLSGREAGAKICQRFGEAVTKVYVVSIVKQGNCSKGLATKFRVETGSR